MTGNQNRFGLNRTIAGIIALASVCLAVGLIPSAQGQLADEDSLAGRFQTDMTNPLMPQPEAEARSVTSTLNEDFGHAPSVPVLKEIPQLDKPSSLPGIDAGYGQLFPDQHLFPPHTSAGVEAPSWLFLKVSFSF